MGEMSDRAGTRWVVFGTHEHPKGIPDPEREGWFIYSSGKADWYGVGQWDNWSIRRGGKFKTAAKAQVYADELNRLDVQGPIPPEFVERRKRLKRLAPYFRAWAYTSEEGPPEGRWPVNPDRYLVMDGGVGWHAESWETLVPDLAAVEAALKEDESNVYRVVDLDTGEDVPFTREVSVTVGAEISA
jgi:hypothetical protein